MIGRVLSPVTFAKWILNLFFVGWVCLVLLVPSPSIANKDAPRPLRLTLLAPDVSTFWSRMSAFSVKAAEDLGIEMEVIYTAQAGEQLIEAAKRNGTDGIIAHGSDKAILNVMALADQHQVPFITINADVTDGQLRPRERFKYWLGSVLPNDFEAGRTLIRKLVNQARVNGKTQHEILALVGWPKHIIDDSSYVRLAGMNDFVESVSDVKSVSVRAGQWLAEKAQIAALEEFSKNPGISIVWCANDNMANGIAALVEEGKLPKDLIVGGIDWDPLTAVNIKAGKLNSSVGGHFLDGAWATILLFDYLNGLDFAFQQVEFNSVMVAVDKSNLPRLEAFFTNELEDIDFSNYSLHLNPQQQSYDFSLSRLMTQARLDGTHLNSAQRQWLNSRKAVNVGFASGSIPLGYWNENKVFSGVASGFVFEIATKLNTPMKVKKYQTPLELENELLSGRLDMLAMVEPKVGMYPGVVLSEPYMRFPLVLLTPNDRIKPINSLLELSGARVALIADNANVTFVHDLINNHTTILFDVFSDFHEAAEALRNENVEAIVHDLASASHMIHVEGLRDINIAMDIPYERTFSFAVSEAQEILIDILNASIRDIDAQKQAEIKNRWLRVTLNVEQNYLYLLKYAVSAGVVVLILTIMALIYIRSLRRARQAMEAANKAKSAFLANMSHEIRTPMNAILGMTRQALKTSEDEHQKKLLENVHVGANHLLGIINDILDFSKFDSGSLVLERGVVDLEELVSELATLTYIKAGEKQVHLQFDVDLNSLMFFYGDPVRIKQILLNLIGNAVKFTPRGGVVRFDVTVTVLNEATCLFHCSIEDTGVGIEESKIKNLFSPFVQADESTTRKFGGTGLGLSICRQLADAMGGKIRVESIVGQGSTFNLDLRLDKVAGKVQTIGSVCEEILQEIALKKIILVSLGDGNTPQLSRWFERFSNLEIYRVHELEEINHSTVTGDILIVDQHFGCDLKILQQVIVSHYSMPCLVLTCASNENLKNIVTDYSRVALMEKPFSPVAFTRALAGLLANSNEVYTDTAQDFEAHAEPQNLDGLKVLLVEDNEINQQLAMMMLEDLNASVEVAVNGLEAVDALKKGTFDLVLMDCQMPVMDGYEATRQIRKEIGLHKLPIIAMTANVLAGDKEKAYSVGMNDYITKPIDEALFCQTLIKWAPRTAKS